MSIRSNLTRRLLFAVAVATAVFALAASVTVWSQREDPSTKAPAGPEPSRVIAGKSRAIPPIAAGADAKASVARFIDFAGNAGLDQREEIRKALATARENTAAIDAFCEEAFSAQRSDHSRALLTLSLLGEIRGPAGAKCLERFMKIPFPTGGTKIDGEIIEQTSLGELQAKAIDGLAYLHNADANAIVLNAIKSHPSIIVRAEAIEAYLWNNRDKAADARKTVMGVVRKGEEIYLDRVRRDTGESSESFNAKLAAFLRAHPEANAPAPEKETRPDKPKQDTPSRLPNPPRF